MYYSNKSITCLFGDFHPNLGEIVLDTYMDWNLPNSLINLLHPKKIRIPEQISLRIKWLDDFFLVLMVSDENGNS